MARTPVETQEKRKLRRGIGNRSFANVEDDKAALARVARRERVMTLRLRSLAWVDIGRELGISTSQAWKDFQEWKLHQPASPIAADVREEEEPKLLRSHRELSIMSSQTLAKSQKEGISHAEFVELVAVLARLNIALTKVSESRRSLHGADAPQKKELSGPGGGPVPVASTRMTIVELLELAESNKSE
jgi:hypothetical protein